MSKYHGEFESRADIVALYDESRVPPEDEIVYAYRSEPDYSESLTVVFMRDGQLYEIYDSHCSCNGWDEDGDTWTKPEPTSVGALLMRSLDNENLIRAVAEALTKGEVVKMDPGPRRALALSGGLAGRGES